jgi:uncharacterized protein involved in exopolysaccharide biosynthesis
MGEAELHQRDIFRILWRRKWVIVAVPLFAGALTYWFTATSLPVYEASSAVQISRVAATVQALLLEVLSWHEGDNIATQSEIITSQKIKARVALRLARKYPEFQEVPSLLGDAEETDYDALQQRVGENPRLAELITAITVEPQRKGDSDIVAIQATASSAGLAIDTANYAAEEFVTYNIAERNREIRQAVQFIQDSILETEQQLREAERTLQDFERDHADTLSLEVGEVGGIQEKMDSLGRKVAHLEEAIAQLEAKTDVGQYFTFSPALTETEDPQIYPLEQQVLRLILQINESKRQRSELLSYLKEESREIRLNTLHTKELENSAEELIGSLLRRYRTLRDELVDQRDALVERHNQLVAVPELNRQLESVQNQVVLKRDALNLFQRRLQDAEIQKAGEVQEVSLIERATTAVLWPSSSRWFKTVIGIVLGILLGGIFVIMLPSRDTSNTTPFTNRY